MTERREKSGLQLLAPPRQFRSLALFKKLRAFDRDGDDAAERVECARLDGTAGRAKNSDWPCAHAERNEADCPPVNRHFAMAGVRLGVRIEIERRLCGCKCRVQLL